jgi:hypothetical protein
MKIEKPRFDLCAIDRVGIGGRREMFIRLALAAGLFLAASASAQQAPPAQDETPRIVVTGEDRSEAFEQQRKAEQAAGEARRLFSGLKDGGGNVGMACRSAAEADNEYAQAIAEAERLANDAQPAIKARLEEHAKSMKERSENLEDLAKRFCDGAIPRRNGVRQNGGPGNRGGRP